MKKNRLYALAAIALLASLSVTGCRQREKIDISTLHTESAEETAPEKETMEAMEETTAAETKEAEDSKDASSALSVQAKTATFKDGKISIEYPVLSNLRDSGIEKKVNEKILEIAKSPVAYHELDKDKDTVEVKYNMIALEKGKAVMVFKGSSMSEGAAHPMELYYTASFDLETGKLKRLSDYADPYTLAGYLVSDDCKVIFPDFAVAETLDYVKGGVTGTAEDQQTAIDEWTEVLKEGDFNENDMKTFPSVFSYENQGNIYFTIPLPHVLGEYAVISFTPDTK